MYRQLASTGSAALGFALLLIACAPKDEAERGEPAEAASERHGELTPGAQGEALQAGAALEGSLLLDLELRARYFRLSVLRSGADPAQRLAEGRVLEGGRFHLQELAPGRIDLGISILGALAPCHVVSGVDLVAGETARDPRLAAIDLRGRFRALDFLVVDAAGERARGVLVDVFYPEKDASACAATIAYPQDRVTLLVEKGPVDLRLRVNGCRVTWVRDAGQPERVAMEPQLALRLRLATPLGLAPGTVLRPLVHFDGTGIAAPPRQATQEAFDDRGEYVLQVGEPGSYAIAYEVAVQKTPGLRPSKQLGIEPQFIDVLDIDQEQVFLVDVPRAAVDETLASMR